MSKFWQFEAIINDIVGSMVTVWACILLTTHADWTYIVMLALGLSAVIGKKLINLSNPVGGGNGQSSS